MADDDRPLQPFALVVSQYIDGIGPFARALHVQFFIFQISQPQQEAPQRGSGMQAVASIFVLPGQLAEHLHIIEPLLFFTPAGDGAAQAQIFQQQVQYLRAGQLDGLPAQFIQRADEGVLFGPLPGGPAFRLEFIEILQAAFDDVLDILSTSQQQDFSY